MKLLLNTCIHWYTQTHKRKHKQEDVLLWIAFVANATNRSLVCYSFKVMSVHGRCCFIVQSVDCGVCASWLLVHPLCAGFWQECVLLLQGLVCWHSVLHVKKINICWYSDWGCWKSYLLAGWERRQAACQMGRSRLRGVGSGQYKHSMFGTPWH